MQLDKKDIEDILKTRFQSGFLKLSDFPSPDTLFGLEQAAQLIFNAVKSNQQIVLVGDYDVDGVMATAVMQWFFEAINYEVEYIIPNRFRDGYGVSEKIIQRVDCDMIITVDNGISAVEAAKVCKQKGITLIITDHHTPPKELPEAAAIIDPKLSQCGFKYKEICGAQVAWYLCAKLKKLFGVNFDLKELIGDVSIAVVADVMPLQDINRAFVKAGLELLEKSTKPYMLALKTSMAKEKLNAQDIGFFIAPKLNSAGRMEDAKLALDFVTATSLPKAMKLLEELNGLNSLRKDTQNQIFHEALQQVKIDDTIIVVEGAWHEGVIGIVASFLVQRFAKPALVFSYKDGVYKGSARSYGDIDIYSIISSYKDLLLGFGGHVGAAGLSIEEQNYQSFKAGISKKIYKEPVCDDFCIGKIDFEIIDWDLVAILQRYEPYGEKNPQPTFETKTVNVIDVKKVGEHKEHTIMKLQKGLYQFKAIFFNCDKSIERGMQIDIEYSINKNSFQNQTSIQLQIVKLDL